MGYPRLKATMSITFVAPYRNQRFFFSLSFYPYIRHTTTKGSYKSTYFRCLSFAKWFFSQHLTTSGNFALLSSVKRFSFTESLIWLFSRHNAVPPLELHFTRRPKVSDVNKLWNVLHFNCYAYRRRVSGQVRLFTLLNFYLLI